MKQQEGKLQVRGSLRRAQNRASGPGELDTLTQQAASSRREGRGLAFPPQSALPGPRSEGQVPGVKQLEGPVLAEEGVSVAHLAGHMLFLLRGPWEEMPQASNRFLGKKLSEQGSPARPALGICHLVPTL